jgi:hypothetical protein
LEFIEMVNSASVLSAICGLVVLGALYPDITHFSILKKEEFEGKITILTSLQSRHYVLASQK